MNVIVPKEETMAEKAAIIIRIAETERKTGMEKYSTANAGAVVLQNTKHKFRG